jgi:hypothetical protein
MLEHKHVLASAIAICGVLLSGSARSGDLFSLTGTVSNGPNNAVTESADFSTAEQLLDEFKNGGLSALFPNYNANSAVDAVGSFRGLPIDVFYGLNSTTLTLQIPAIGLSQSFTGATRDASDAELVAFLKTDGGKFLTELNQALVARTASDPVAGNPNSLVAIMANANFAAASSAGTVDPVKGTRLDNPFGLSLQTSAFHAGGADGEAISLPLSYAFVFDDPRYAVLLDLPISYVDRGGSASYLASFGLGGRFPVLDHWSLTPGLRIGAVGSPDEFSAALVYSGSLTSNYNIYYDDLIFSIDNSAGYYKSIALDVGSINIDPGTENELFKNGVSVEGAVDFLLFGRPTSWQAYVVDNETAGNAAFVSHWDEFGVSFGTRQRPDSNGLDIFRVGLGFAVGNNDYLAYQLNVGLKF